MHLEGTREWAEGHRFRAKLFGTCRQRGSGKDPSSRRQPSGARLAASAGIVVAMRQVDTAPEDFLASLDEDVRQDMERIDALIGAAMTGRSRVLWEGVFWGGTEQRIIGYGDLVQPRPRGQDVRWFVVGLARQKAFISVYVNAARDGKYLLADYADRLGRVKTGSAVVNFRTSDDLDLDAFAEMIAMASDLCPPDPK